MLSRFVCFIILSVVFSGSAPSQTDRKIKPSKKWISSITFSGNTLATDEELIDLFLTNDDLAGPVNVLFVERHDVNGLKDRLERAIKMHLAASGYSGSRINGFDVVDEGETVRIAVRIDEGTPVRLGKVTVSGARSISPASIVHDFPARPGDTLSFPAVKEFVYKRLIERYQSQGYAAVSAAVESDLKLNPAGGNERIADITIWIDEGTTFLINEINVVGSAADRTVAPYLLFKTGETFDILKIQQSIRDLNESGLFYTIDPEADLDFRSESMHQRININLRVNELPPQKFYTLGSVKFIGEKPMSDERLRTALCLDQTGTLFNVSVFTECVKQVNAARLLRPITESALQLELGKPGMDDDETSTELNITIKVQEFPKPL